MDIECMCRHYQEIFADSQDVLDWIKHDLQHMGMEEVELEAALNRARKCLKLWIEQQTALT